MRMTLSKRLRSTVAVGMVAVAASVGGLSAGAQLTGQNKPTGTAEQAATIKVTARLIIENVGVKDKKGEAIGGLTAKDFTITEDGVPQTIKVFEHQVLPEDATPLGPAPAGGEEIKIYNRLATSQITGEAAGEIKYTPSPDGAVLRYDDDASGGHRCARWKQRRSSYGRR